MRSYPPEVKLIWIGTAEEKTLLRKKRESAVTAGRHAEVEAIDAVVELLIRPDLLSWGKYFFPHYLTDEPSGLHKWLITELQSAHRHRGKSTAVVAPRESAKTTWTSKLYTIYCLCEQLEPYQLLVSDTLKQARKNLASIRDELIGNDRLKSVYPETCGKGPRWNTTELETRNGQMVEAIGSGASSRGTTFKNHRPSRISIDDLMNDKQCRSEIRREQLTEWFLNSLLPMGNRDTNVFFVGTALHRKDTLQLLRVTPGWKFKSFKSVIKEAANQSLWDQWKAMYRNPMDPVRADTALAFFKANRTEMLRGSKVLWPEHESLYDLMVYRNTKGEKSFQAEKQGNPTAASKAEWPDDYFPPNIWFDRWPECIAKVIALDPSKGKSDTSDYSAYVIAGQSHEGVIYIEADMERRDCSTIINDGFTLYHKHLPIDIVIEINQFQELLMDEFNRQAIERNLVLPITGVSNMLNKKSRIRQLGPYLTQGKLRFKAGSEATKLLVEQLREFPFGSHDDGPDALQMAVRDLQRLLTCPVE